MFKKRILDRDRLHSGPLVLQSAPRVFKGKWLQKMISIILVNLLIVGFISDGIPWLLKDPLAVSLQVLSTDERVVRVTGLPFKRVGVMTGSIANDSQNAESKIRFRVKGPDGQIRVVAALKKTGQGPWQIIKTDVVPVTGSGWELYAEDLLMAKNHR